MKKILPVILISLFVTIISSKENKLYSQSPMSIISCSDSAAVVALVDTVLLGGVPSYAKQSIKFYGDPQSVGYYSNADFIGYETSTGLVMSTGHVSDIAATNTCSTVGISTNTGGPTDTDLNALAGNVSYDACIIEFNIKPNADSVLLDLIFASEEYHGYVLNFSDIIGVFISGPGIDGPYSNNAINIAEVPNTSLPIGPKNINIGPMNEVCQTPNNCVNCEYFNSNTDPAQNIFNRFPFNGYTTPIEASTSTSQCQWYNVKIVIGDIMDRAYDSGLFLEKNTVDIGSVSVDLNLPDPEGEYLVEGCGEAYVNFSLNQPLSYDFYIRYVLEGSAMYDVDYETNSSIIDTLVLYAGQLSDSISFTAINDGVEEPIEDIQLIYGPEMCNPFINDTVFVFISDPLDSDQLDIDISDSTYCYSTDLIATPGFVSYEWNTGETTSTITVFGEGEYSVTAFDSVSCPATKSREVPPPQLPYTLEEICLLTTDINTERNMIVVEKTYDVNTDSILYYSLNKDSIYEKIGSQQFEDEWVFIDDEFPSRSNTYRIILKDSCGNMSILSDYHKTMWLESEGEVKGDVILNWNPYEGFDYPEFEIYRNANDEGFSIIGTTPNNVYTYTDILAPEGNLEYQIRVMPETDTICIPFKDIYSGSFSNKINVTVVGIKDIYSADIKVYPNPSKDLVNIESNRTKVKSVAVLDNLGRQISYSTYSNSENNLVVNLNKYKSGVYTILVNDSFAYKILKY